MCCHLLKSVYPCIDVLDSVMQLQYWPRLDLKASFVLGSIVDVEDMISHGDHMGPCWCQTGGSRISVYIVILVCLIGATSLIKQFYLLDTLSSSQINIVMEQKLVHTHTRNNMYYIILFRLYLYVSVSPPLFLYLYFCPFIASLYTLHDSASLSYLIGSPVEMDLLFKKLSILS